MIRIPEVLVGLVPASKPFWIIVSLLATGWFGGVGFTVGFGEQAANIKVIPEIKETLDLHDQRFLAVEDRLDRAESSGSRMMCLMEMTATGERVLAAELDRRVRECQTGQQ